MPCTCTQALRFRKLLLLLLLVAVHQAWPHAPHLTLRIINRRLDVTRRCESSIAILNRRLLLEVIEHVFELSLQIIVLRWHLFISLFILFIFFILISYIYRFMLFMYVL